MRQVAARVKHPCFGVRVASVHKINRLHLENVACRGEKLFFEKTVFKTFCGEKDDKYMKTPHFRAVFSVLHLSSTHFVRRLQFGYFCFCHLKISMYYKERQSLLIVRFFRQIRSRILQQISYYLIELYCILRGDDRHI